MMENVKRDYVIFCVFKKMEMPTSVNQKCMRYSCAKVGRMARRLPRYQDDAVYSQNKIIN